LIEFSWKCNGMMYTIDWKNYQTTTGTCNAAAAEAAAAASSSSSRINRQEIRMIQLEDVGCSLTCLELSEKGVATIAKYMLNSCIRRRPSSTTADEEQEQEEEVIQVRFTKSKSNKKRGTSSSTTPITVLEVYPIQSSSSSNNNIVDKKCVRSHLALMQNRGFRYRQQDGFLTYDIKHMKDHYFDLISLAYMSFGPAIHQIPSDTGLVSLRLRDTALIALCNIKPNCIITSVPYTAVSNVIHSSDYGDHPTFCISRLKGRIIRKAFIPFGGLGGFVKWSNHQPNSTLMLKKVDDVPGLLLISITTIHVSQHVTCSLDSLNKKQEHDTDNIVSTMYSSTTYKRLFDSDK